MKTAFQPVVPLAAVLSVSLACCVHRDVRIVGNRFVGCGNSGVFVSATDGVVVKDNTFENCSIRRYDRKDERNLFEIRLHNCAHETVSGNRTDKSPDRLVDRR